MKYKHTQHGYVTGVLLVIFGAAVLVASFTVGDVITRYLLLVQGGLFLGLASIFSTLTIEITTHELRWYFGPISLVNKKVELMDIAHVTAVRTKIIEGWGIHYTSRGWLYNISGFGAVLVEKTDGSTFMIGTDEPEKLSNELMSFKK